MATRLRMQSAALGFGLSVGISFLYYGVMRAGQALGHNGALPPYVAAWMGDVAVRARSGRHDAAGAAQLTADRAEPGCLERVHRDDACRACAQ